MMRGFIVPGVRVFVGQLGYGVIGIHSRIPGHVRHIHEQNINFVGIASPRISNH